MAATFETRAQPSWSGAGTLSVPALWSDTNSWSGGTPISSGSYSLTFVNASTSYSQNNLAGLTLSALTFDSSAQGNTLTGNAVTLTGDVTVASSATQTVSLATSLASGSRTFAINAGQLIWTAILSGTGGLVKTGSGTLQLTGFNTFSGGTTINAGTLQLSGGGGTGILRGTVTVNIGGTLLTTAQDALGFNTGTKVDSLIIAGGTVTHNASGNLTLSTMAVSLTGGTLQSTGSGAIDFFDSTSASSSTGNTTITSNASATTSLIAGSVRLRQGDNDATGTLFTVADGAAATDLHVSANLTEGAAQSVVSAITKTGSGLMLLSGSNNYSGPTTVSAGILRAGSTQAFGNNSAVSLANTAGASLDLNGFNNSLGSLSGGGITGGTVTLGSATLTVGGANTSPSAYAGVISGSGALVKTGTGTLQLTGFNTFSGGTTINAGTLQLNASGGVGTGIVRGTVTVNTGGTLLTTAQDALGWNTGTRVTTLNINGGTVTHSSANNLSLAATTVNLTGGILQSTHASGRIDWLIADGTKTSINSLASSTLSSIGGTVWLRQGDGNLTGTIITVADGSAPVDLLISANLVNYSTASAISKAGPGTLRLSGNNNYAGATFINAGTLQVGSATALPSGSTVNLANGATLDLQSFSATAASLVFAGGGRMSFNLGTPGNSTGLLALSGTLNKSGSGSYFLDFTGGQLGTYRLSTFSSTTFGAGDFTLGFGVGYAGILTVSATALDLNITAIPEPASFGFFAALGSLLCTLARRPRRQSA